MWRQQNGNCFQGGIFSRKKWAIREKTTNCRDVQGGENAQIRVLRKEAREKRNLQWVGSGRAGLG